MAAVHLRDVEAVTGIPYKTLTRWAQAKGWPHVQRQGRKFYDWRVIEPFVAARQERYADAA